MTVGSSSGVCRAALTAAAECCGGARRPEEFDRRLRRTLGIHRHLGRLSRSHAFAASGFSGRFRCSSSAAIVVAHRLGELIVDLVELF
jgi:hypothetical protein